MLSDILRVWVIDSILVATGLVISCDWSEISGQWNVVYTIILII